MGTERKARKQKEKYTRKESDKEQQAFPTRTHKAHFPIAYLSSSYSDLLLFLLYFISLLRNVYCLTVGSVYVKFVGHTLKYTVVSFIIAYLQALYCT